MTNPNGITSEQVKEFCALLTGANTEQLVLMRKEIAREQKRREGIAKLEGGAK